MKIETATVAMWTREPLWGAERSRANLKNIFRRSANFQNVADAKFEKAKLRKFSARKEIATAKRLSNRIQERKTYQGLCFANSPISLAHLRLLLNEEIDLQSTDASPSLSISNHEVNNEPEGRPNGCEGAKAHAKSHGVPRLIDHAWRLMAAHVRR
jgi:hypothetical protein